MCSALWQSNFFPTFLCSLRGKKVETLRPSFDSHLCKQRHLPVLKRSAARILFNQSARRILQRRAISQWTVTSFLTKMSPLALWGWGSINKCVLAYVLNNSKRQVSVKFKSPFGGRSFCYFIVKIVFASGKSSLILTHSLANSTS